MGFEGGSVVKKAAVYFGLLVLAILASLFFGLTFLQTVAVAIVLALVLGTVLFWEVRLSFALIGSAVLFAAGLLNVHKFVEFAHLEIIVFLAGMMIFVGYLEKYAFFEYLISKIIKLVGGGGKRIFVLLMFLSALFAALVDEVTSILFMLSIVLYLTARLRVNPVPFVMATVFATNIGSSATAVGNPVGVVIALNAKLSFSDFLQYATPISFAALVVVMIATFLYFRKDIEEFATKARAIPVNELIESHSSQNLLVSSILFFGVLASLIAHAKVEELLGLEKNAMLLGTALAASGIVLLLEAKTARQFVETKVDWWTLFFFMMLFSSVGALEETGVMQVAAKGFSDVFGSSPGIAMGAIIVISGLLSAVLDNVLAVAVFVPLVHDLQNTAIAGDYLWWSLLFGATLFGNLTLIGSTANIVALGLIEKRGLPKISFMEWFKAGIVVVSVTVITAFGLLYLQYG
ncbi:hypothetical protein HUU53_00600 [Candidatus Micrarchaeota archaeon]|nr:hypothetical protein [Candidatus Micrarchaeota archaeon]